MADSVLTGLTASSGVADGDFFYTVLADGSAEFKATRTQITSNSLKNNAAGTLTVSDAATNASTTVLTISHDTSGTAAAGFGQTLLLQLQDSTTADTNALSLITTWATATHASRKARTVLSVYDTAAREVMRGEASGSAPMIGFLGANASARVAAPDLAVVLNTFGLTSGTPTISTPIQAQAYRPINAQTNTTYTFVVADNGNLVTLSNAGAITATIDTNANQAFPVGAEIDIVQLGAGKVTVAAAGGVTLHSQSGNKSLAAQYAGATLKQIATDSWLLIGNLIA